MTDWEPTARREGAGGRVVLVMLLCLLVLVGGAYVGAWALAGETLPRRASVAGVPVGGLTVPAAVGALRDGLAERAQAPLEVTVAGRPETFTPSEAGLGVDYAASVAAVSRLRSWEPSTLWDHYAGGEDLEPVVTVDDRAMNGLLRRIAADVERPARDGAVSFEGDRIRTTRPRTGQQLDVAAARAAVVGAYLQDGVVPELPLEPAPPEIDNDDVQAALAGFANPAMSAPVTLVFGDSPIRLQPRDYAPALALRAEGGVLVPHLDSRVLTRLVDGEVSDHDDPVDATVRLVDGRPRVVHARPGVRYEPRDVTRAFLRLVTRSDGRREMEVRARVAEPAFTTRDARRLAITERVSTFTTYFPYAEYRNTNIGRAAELVDGTVLRPGKTFSLNDTVGERTRANGFTEGFIISDGIFEEDLGGGVSQLATTLFNAMYFAGLEDVEHKPHSFYIDRYPVGREATVAWGSVDLRFRNDTPYGVLISAHVTPSTPSSDGVVRVDMWSTKYWDITSTTGERHHFTAPRTRRLHGPDCYPNTGYDGFDIDVTRHFRRHGHAALDHDEVFHTHYIPSDTVVCD